MFGNGGYTARRENMKISFERRGGGGGEIYQATGDIFEQETRSNRSKALVGMAWGGFGTGIVIFASIFIFKSHPYIHIYTYRVFKIHPHTHTHIHRIVRIFGFYSGIYKM